MAEDDDTEFESGRLFELYTRYVTEPESKRDVYGYTILLIGYLLGMAGMVVYLVGPSGGELDPLTILVREISFPAAGLGLVITMFGIVLMLPVKRKGIAVGVLGTLMGIGAAGWFVVAYPQNWSIGTPDYSPQIITLYTAGIALVAGVVVMVPIVTGERSYFAAATEVLGQDYQDIMIGEADHGELFAIFKRGSDWTWRLIDQAAIAASTEDFLSKLETEDRVDRVKDRIEGAALIEITHAAFRLYKTAEDRWRWLLMQEDGNVVADSGDEYPSREAAEGSVNDLKEYGPQASIFGIDEAAIESYPDNGQWRWRLIDDQRQTIAEGPDRYSSRDAAHDAADSFVGQAVEAPMLTVGAYGIELFERNEEWHWQLLDSELTPLAGGNDIHGTKGRAEDAVYDHLERLGMADYLNGEQPSYDVVQPMADRWQWQLITQEGRTVAMGPDMVSSANSATEEARSFKANAPDAETVEIRDQDFELYQAGGAWHWRLVDGDRNVRAHSTDDYNSQSEAADAIEHLRLHAPDADLIEFEKAAFQIYESDEGQWRWRLIDEDYNLLADSSEGEYDSRDGATSAMSTLKEYAPDADQLEIETAAFELFEEAGQWGWRLVDDIGETIARGERRYPSREEAQEDMDALRDEVSDVEARVMDHGTFQVYHDSSDTWWWRFLLPSGDIIAESPDGFGTRHEAEDAIESIIENHVTAEITTVGRLAILLDRRGEAWSWELVNHDREPIAESTQTFDSQAAARSAIGAIQAAVNDITVFEIRDVAFMVMDGEGWRWALIDDDHATIANTPETYDTTDAAEAAVGEVQELAGEAAYIDYDQAAFELIEGDDGWQWRLIDEDRAVIAASTETYPSRTAVESTIEAIRDELPEASILEFERAAFEFHEDEAGWRWRLIDETGNELAESLEAYESRTDARESLTTIKEYAPDAWTSIAD